MRFISTHRISHFLFGFISFLVVIITDYFSRSIRNDICVSDFSKYLNNINLPSFTATEYLSVSSVWIFTAALIFIVYLFSRKKLKKNIFLSIEMIYIAIRPILILFILIFKHYTRTLPISQLSNISSYYKIAFITIENMKFVKEYGLSISYIPIIIILFLLVFNLLKASLKDLYNSNTPHQ